MNRIYSTSYNHYGYEPIFWDFKYLLNHRNSMPKVILPRNFTRITIWVIHLTYLWVFSSLFDTGIITIALGALKNLGLLLYLTQPLYMLSYIYVSVWQL